MISSISKHKDEYFIAFLFLFSISINQYYGNRGVFPLDSFHFFDSGFRILNGEVPFTDYWLVKGPFLDYSTALFFFIFGVSWQSYLLQASILNSIVTVSTYLLFKSFNLKNTYCLLYSFLLSILAYPSSGTPFIDHHSAFFSLLGIYSLLYAMKNNYNIYWLLAPILFGISFISKQVPAAYIILSSIFILLIFGLINKKFYFIKYCFIGSLIFFVFFIALGFQQGISFTSFIEQYILYPQTIGLERVEDLNLTFNAIISRFKFIYFILIPFLFINVKRIADDKFFLKNIDFYIFLFMIFLAVSLIFHQLITKNQIFIFFLIPILAGFLHISLNNSQVKYKKSILSFLIIICLISATKYHLRFNVERKFHELTNANFQISEDAKKIHKKFFGLKWITPEYLTNPNDEIDLILRAKKIMKSDIRNKMIITNYHFFSFLLGENLSAPSRVYTFDGTTHPLKNNEYSDKYQNLMDDLIINNKIEVIYFVNVGGDFHYIDSYKHCYEKNLFIEKIISYELKNCI
jgi:hypothetical protein